MDQRTYSVQDKTGQWSPPIPEAELYGYARNDALPPDSMIRIIHPHSDNKPFSAATHPGLAVIFRQRGISISPTGQQKAASQALKNLLAEENIVDQPPPIHIHSSSNKTAGLLMCAIGTASLLWFVIRHPFPFGNTLAFTHFILSSLVGVWAYNKGLSYFWGAGMSLCLTPFVGFIAVGVTAKNEGELERRWLKTGTVKKCPYCAEIIRVEAKVCRFCQRSLTEASTDR